MKRPDHSFTEIAGTPVHYARLEPPLSYGTRGRQQRFHSTPQFHQKLNAAFQELWDLCPLRKAEVITTAGAWVAKPRSHGMGRGFDLDAVFWTDKAFVTLNYPQDRRFYLGIEAILRKHFGNVLNYEFDAAHHDHFHVDDLIKPSFRSISRANVLFLQMALSYLFERPIEIDGRIGPQTRGAASDALIAIGIASPNEVSDSVGLDANLARAWPQFLDEAARRGFANLAPAVVAERTPLDLIENLYAVIEQELGGSASRKQIETALTNFVEHQTTSEWLNQF